MKTPADAMKVLNGQSSFYWAKIKGFFVCHCLRGDESEYWMFERAPEPTDIFWENLGTSTINRVCSSLISWIFSIIMMSLGFAIIAYVKLL